MKKTSLFIFVILSIVAFGQKVSDFKYVSVPEKFSTFKDDYGLEGFLTKSLKGKKYIVIPANKQQWPAEAQENQCNVINANVVNNSSFLRNKILLQFKDCNDKVILESKGSSDIKEFIEGYNDALQKSLVSVPVSTPTATNIIASNSTPTQPIENKEKPLSSVAIADKRVTRYSNGKLDLQRIQLDDKQFILADNSTSYATFKETTKKDVFRVKLQNGETTIGYLEGGNIVIEIPQSNGEYSKEIFSAK